jgi:hypothetical protein
MLDFKLRSILRELESFPLNNPGDPLFIQFSIMSALSLHPLAIHPANKLTPSYLPLLLVVQFREHDPDLGGRPSELLSQLRSKDLYLLDYVSSLTSRVRPCPFPRYLLSMTTCCIEVSSLSMVFFYACSGNINCIKIHVM